MPDISYLASCGGRDAGGSENGECPLRSTVDVVVGEGDDAFAAQCQLSVALRVVLAFEPCGMRAVAGELDDEFVAELGVDACNGASARFVDPL